MGFATNNDFELAVIIRSIFYNSTSKHLHIAVGGAITHLCEPETEYEECLLKAKALAQALGAGLGLGLDMTIFSYFSIL
jgi:para-aminobenzoate synthetase component 1